MNLIRLVLTLAGGLIIMGCAAETMNFDNPDSMYSWACHDIDRPLPPVVTPGEQPNLPPSDAIVLFDGQDVSAWEAAKEGVTNFPWKVENGYMEVAGKSSIQTKQAFGSCQIHVEWASPEKIKGNGQGRGNSGVYLMNLYEIQILDSYNNPTYADGQAGAAYGQNPPLVNACLPPGQWQTYDIIFHAPKFEGGKLARPASVTVLHNGVLVQDHWIFTGPTAHKVRQAYKPHPEKLPLLLQDHGNPVRFRNIWIRELKD